MDRKLQRHRADSLRQHGFLVLLLMMVTFRSSEVGYSDLTSTCSTSSTQ